jgi:2-polyprenyl-3-methyl-5-hydroxy-6-metoxy-1,4-benzoquinol methylase
MKIDRMTTTNTKVRAILSKGSSNESIYNMVLKSLDGKFQNNDVIVDVGCGQGNLYQYMKEKYNRYVGVDVVKYEGFPDAGEFRLVNLDSGKIDLPDNFAETVCSVETIEHLENPRAFIRELVRVAKPNGSIVVTTPNQLSLLSKLTLTIKNEFNAFQESPGCYPSHITALLEIDLIRIFQECGLTDIKISYSNQGRIPFTSIPYPKIPVFQGRNFSDNILCSGVAKT